MKTVSANFQTILKKDPSIPTYYVVKMTGSTNTYYLSSRETTITDSGTKRVLGLLLNAPEIKETIDLYSGQASVGGFSIRLSDYDQGGGSRFSDNFTTEYFYNREVKIYLQAEGLTALSDCLLLYTGIFEDYGIENEVIRISITNNNASIMRNIPANKITSSGYPNAPQDSIGKREPIVYGDHSFKYGQDGTSINVTRSKQNNMAKPLRIGQDPTDGKHYYLIADHELKTSESVFYRAWMQEPKTGDLVKIDASNYSVSVVGGKTYLILDQLTNVFYVYKYVYPHKILNNYYSDVLMEWDNPDNAKDDDSTTYSQALVYSLAVSETDYGGILIYTTYNDENVGTFTSSQFYFQCYYNDADGFSLDYGRVGSALTALGSQDGTTLLNDSGTYTGAEVTRTYQFLLTLDVDAGRIADARVYNCFREIKYVPAELDLDNIYVACFGKDMTGAYDEAPHRIINDVVTEYTDGAVNSDDLTAMLTNLTNSFKLSFAITELINTKELLKNIVDQSKAYLHINTNNEVGVFTFGASYTTDFDDIKINDIKADTLKTSKTKINQSVNDLSLEYYLNPETGEFQSSLSRAYATAKTNYNETYEKILNADMIRDDTTAGLLADHYCKDASMAYWGEPKNLVEFETADFRGSDFWVSGTFRMIGSLEMFDIIEFDHTEFDNFKLCNGESWEDKQFLIYEITRGRTLKIKAIEL